VRGKNALWAWTVYSGSGLFLFRILDLGPQYKKGVQIFKAALENDKLP
jgi:hypothetical protein